MADTIVTLITNDFIESARTTGPKFDLSIYKWQLHLVDLESRRMATQAIGTAPPLPPTKNGETAPYAVRALPLADIRDLAGYEQITIADFETATAQFQNIAIPPVSSGVSLSTAVTFIQGLILMCLVWMWVNARELATALPAHAPGDMIWLFGRSALSRMSIQGRDAAGSRRARVACTERPVGETCGVAFGDRLGRMHDCDLGDRGHDLAASHTHHRRLCPCEPR